MDMSNRQLAIGLGLVMICVVAFIGVIIWEVKKAKEYDLKVARLSSAAKKVVVEDTRDFSVYENWVGSDGREMVLIPEGIFTRGSLSGDIDEKPQREIYLDAYYIDKREVSIADYDAYRRATNYIAPSVPFFDGDEKLWKGNKDYPVVGVSWYDAFNYCQWAGKRLLTEAEWEKAARGTHGLDFPWGNKDADGVANIAGSADGHAVLAPVGSFPAGRSVYGIYDMSGNVHEWVADWYDQFYYETAPLMRPTGPDAGKNRVFRGGSWDSRKPDVRAAKRYAATEGRKDATVGIRCGLSQKDKPAN